MWLQGKEKVITATGGSVCLRSDFLLFVIDSFCLRQRRICLWYDPSWCIFFDPEGVEQNTLLIFFILSYPVILSKFLFCLLFLIFSVSLFSLCSRCPLWLYFFSYQCNPVVAASRLRRGDGFFFFLSSIYHCLFYILYFTLFSLFPLKSYYEQSQKQ